MHGSAMTDPAEPTLVALSGRQWFGRIVGLLLLMVAAVFGAHQLRFLCDDAYITFRHVSNAMDGHGLVWNPPPFLPVEGTTGFLWAMLLWGVWAGLGIEPPDIANTLSIGFGLATLLVVAIAMMRWRTHHGRRIPAVVVLFGLAALVGNRCFLQWMTGGLETAMFNLWIVLWVVLAFASTSTSRRLLWSVMAALAALTRPDGLLLVAATTFTWAMLAILGRMRWRVAMGLSSPAAAVAAHLLWRRWFYGEWLPNTYYAKVTEPWPEAGLRYLYCFGFENGVGVVLPPAVAFAVWLIARRGLAWQRLLASLPAYAAIGAIGVHAAFYVLRVGGDHFEYRVVSHLVPLTVLALVVMLSMLSRRRWPAIAGSLLFALAGSIAWLHLALTRPVIPPDYDLLSDGLPVWARPMVHTFDRHQVWLQLQYNCARCNAHQQALDFIRDQMPSRERLAVASDDIPVVAVLSVGYVGWVMPDCAVIDVLGLNDWVIARNPTDQWAASWLSRDLLAASLGASDPDGDGKSTRAELITGLIEQLSCPEDRAAMLAGILLMLCDEEPDDALVASEREAVLQFFDQLRWMAHERRPPPGYVEAFEPNVVVSERRLVIEPREQPLTAERVRSIELEWRQRMRR